MGRPLQSLLCAFLVVLGAIPLASAQLPLTPVGPQVPGRVLLNVQAGEDLSCSGGGFFDGQADLKARVWRNDGVVAETAFEHDTDTPRWHALFDLEAPGPSTTFSIEVVEYDWYWMLIWFAEVERPCDAASGPGRWLNVTIGADAVSFSGQGDSEAVRVSGHAARAGASPPSPAALRVGTPAPTQVDLNWDASAGTVVTKKVEIRHGAERVLPASATSMRLDGLRENTHYDVRVDRHAGP